MFSSLSPLRPSMPLLPQVPVTLCPESARERFAEEGFLVMPGLCDSADLRHIRSLLLGLFERDAGRAEGNHVDMLGPDLDRRSAAQPQLIKPSLYAPGLLMTRYFQQAQQVASALLGEPAEFSFDHSILKRPGRQAATPWHQDEAHGHDPHFRCQQISFWLPLQDVNEENGCMRYIPGSHQGPLLPHRALGSDPRVHALEIPARYVRDAQSRAVPVPAGWSVLHAGRTVHGSLPNIATHDRLAYVVVFRGTPVARSAPLHFDWLSSQQTTAAVRRRDWLWRGGAAVLMLRWCRRVMRLDRAALLRRLRVRLARLGWAS